MTRRFTILVGLTAVVLMAVVAAHMLTLTATTKAGRDATASSSSAGSIGGPFTLVDTSGKAVTDQTYRGKWMLVFFGYTFCPDACPTALNNVSVALEQFGSQADKLQPLFITVDPKRDTQQVMADYLKSFDHRIVGLTGSQAQIDAATKAYRVYVERPTDEGDDYLVSHSAYLYLMSPEGKFVNVVAGSTPGDQMADKLRQMIAHPGAASKG